MYIPAQSSVYFVGMSGFDEFFCVPAASNEHETKDHGTTKLKE